MLDFRKLTMALVVLMMASVAAYAQPATCTVFSTPQNIRAEGVTELVGDVLLTCTGGIPTVGGGLIPQANIQVFAQPYTEITSRLLGSSTSGASGAPNGFTEAVLFIDEPAPADQTICGGTNAPVSDPNIPVCNQNTAIGSGYSPYVPPFPAGSGITSLGRPNSWLGRRIVTSVSGLSSNSLIWQGVQIEPPGTQGTRIIRIKNVRVNASLLGATLGSPAQVSLQVTITPGNTSAGGLAPPPFTALVINQQPNVATALVTHDFAYDSVSAFQCEAGTAYVANVRWGERSIPSAWKQRSQALDNSSVAPATNDAMNVFYDTESGFYKAAASGAGNWPATLGAPFGARIAGLPSGTFGIANNNDPILGLADHGTRLMVRLTNIPSPISVYGLLSQSVRTGVSLPANPGTVTGIGKLTNTNADGAGPFAAASASATFPAYAALTVAGGAAQATWEILVTDTASFETFAPSLVFSWSASALPAVGSSINGRGWYAPLSNSPYAAGNNSGGTVHPIPRFLDNSVAGPPILTISACRSNLLFPFISNKNGFDTGLAISNTSRDPFTVVAGTGNLDMITGGIFSGYTEGNYAFGFDNAPASQQSGICTLYYYGQQGTTNYYAPSPQPVTGTVLAGDHVTWSLSSGGGAPALAGFQGYLIARCDFQYAHGFAFISDFGAQKLAMGYLALIFEGQTELKNRAPDKFESFNN